MKVKVKVKESPTCDEFLRGAHNEISPALHRTYLRVQSSNLSVNKVAECGHRAGYLIISGVIILLSDSTHL